MTEESVAVKSRSTTKKPEVSSEFARKELDKAAEQVDRFNESVNNLTLDRMREAPKLETEMQVPMSQREMQNAKDIYLKPRKSIGSTEKFNEKFRNHYKYQSEYVKFVAEHKEIIGEVIEMWTKPFPGVPAEFWEVPTNKPVFAPRYVAERIRGCSYHRLKSQDSTVVSSDGLATYHGAIVADCEVQRLDAMPVSNRKSIFMGSEDF